MIFPKRAACTGALLQSRLDFAGILCYNVSADYFTRRKTYVNT